MGRSRGGLTTKIHTVVDTSGLPLRFALSPGQAHDSTLAGALLDDRLPPDSFVLADKAYDAEWIREMIEAQDAVPIIPERRGAKTPHAFSRVLYRLRNRVERFFNKLKQFRRIATRYERLAANYLAMIKIATIRIWLRANESTTKCIAGFSAKLGGRETRNALASGLANMLTRTRQSRLEAATCGGKLPQPELCA